MIILKRRGHEIIEVQSESVFVRVETQRYWWKKSSHFEKGCRVGRDSKNFRLRQHYKSAFVAHLYLRIWIWLILCIYLTYFYLAFKPRAFLPFQPSPKQKQRSKDTADKGQDQSLLCMKKYCFFLSRLWGLDLEREKGEGRM